MPIGWRTIPLTLWVLLLALVPALAAETSSQRQALHLLNRLGFGPTLEDLRHVEAIGAQRYIDEQLDPASIPESPELPRRLAALDTLALSPVQLFAEYGPPLPQGGATPSPEEIKAARERSRIIIQQAMEARILRATLSRRQLQEVMVDFWYNHFNVFADKGPDHLWIGAYEMEAIRPFALGEFKDLLLATARHPAMLFYLDNAQNSAPGSRGAAGKDLGINENYAREVMELHTLGVDGGYRQGDVETLARILTGWTIDRPSLRRGIGDAFVFDPSRHVFGPKIFLGHPIAASGEAEGEEALDILAKSPATAHHVAYELAQYFVADAPPAALVDRLARAFSASNGDIRTVLKALFTSPAFRDSVGDKYKTPEQFVLSAIRAAGVDVQNPRPLQGAMARLGMPLYRCPTPDGYKNTADAWLNPDAVTLRINFATALARGNLPIAHPP
ncbi:MAG: DUF1800 domain-containing protein, partial [Alphaproteobacteria bacterium]|nr:DUF1800 domain-containing protein [Alphaproteobacteria bacterium]